jgi:DNA-binding response OmpR family regulator
MLPRDRGCSGVLIVEDDPAILAILVDVLEDEGYGVSVARNGRDALDALRARPTSPPCLILLDLMMPTMNGAEFRSEQLKDDLLSGIPVLLLTADRNGRRAAEELNVAAMLRKPPDLDELLSLIRRYCDSGGRSRADDRAHETAATKLESEYE